MLDFASVAADSHAGRVRSRNEDAWAVVAEVGALVVADGMGGHAGGGVASRLAVERAAHVLRTGAVATAVDAVLAANAAVVEGARAGGPALHGMGTTLVVLRIAQGLLDLAWVGDSRAYLLRAGRLRQLSHDHTHVQDLVDAGLISAAAAEHHPQRHVLTRTVGTPGLARDDVGVLRMPARAGDRVLLCSDGLTGELGEHSLVACLQGQSDDNVATASLIDRALRAGGRDNITVALATLDE